MNISGYGDFSILNEFEKLEHLYILAGQDLALDISQLQNLQTIALTPAELMGSTNVISSTPLPNLQFLSISPSDSLEVLSNTPNLRVLSVQSWEELSPEPIASLSNLEWLSYNIPGSTQDLSLFSACPNLIYCGLTDTMTATLPEAVILDLGFIDPYGNEIRMMLYDEITGSVSN